jgi:hypothetical protein
MQHQTPQFIDIEDKVVGPFTFRQAIYIGGGLGALFLLYRFLPFFLFLVFSIPVVALVGALAFYKHNNKPFSTLLEAVIKYFSGSRLYLWRHRKPEDIQREKESIKVPEKKQAINPAAGLSSSKLKNLSWSLEVKDEDAV